MQPQLSPQPVEYRIHGRVEASQPDAFIARVWVSRADDPDDREVSITHVCHPCSLSDARQQCDEFVTKVTRQLLAAGHRVAEVKIL